MKRLMIRQYRASDRKDVFDLHIRALKNEDAYMYTGLWEKDFYDIEGMYLENRGEFLVGIIDDQIIDMGALRKMTEDIFILRVRKSTRPRLAKLNGRHR